MARTIETTAGALAQVLYGCTAAELTRGQTYAGTEIQLRQVPEDAAIIVTVHANGAGATVGDNDGGWIADHLGPALGARQVRKLQPPCQ